MTDINRTYGSVTPYGMTSEIGYLESPVDGGSAGDAVFEETTHIYQFHETEATGRGVVDTVGDWTEEMLKAQLDLTVAYLVEPEVGDPYYTTTPPPFGVWSTLRSVWFVRFDRIEDKVSNITATVVSQDIDGENDVASIQLSDYDGFDSSDFTPSEIMLGGENYTIGEPFEPLGKAGMAFTYFAQSEEDPGPGTHEIVLEMTCDQFATPVTVTFSFVVEA